MDSHALEWDNKEHDENGGNNMTRIFSKGLAVGKKMLITGVVISSAPVILPPLMVISTLGLVCAVPYGLFLASYACTQTLVGKLLPPFPKAWPVTCEDLRAKDEYGIYGGDVVDMVNEEEELRRIVDTKLEQDEEENREEGINVKDKSVEENCYVDDVLEKENQKPIEETRGIMNVIESGSNLKEEVPRDDADVAVEVELGKIDDSKANEELVERTTGLLEKSRDEGALDEGEGKGEREGAEQEPKGTDRVAQQIVTQSRNCDGGSTKNTKANRAKQNRKAKKVGAREVAETGIDQLDDKKKASTENATSEGNKKSGLEDNISSEVTSLSNVKAPGSDGAASKEVLYSEEKIWKQIDAMRAIVGYTTARHTTCIDELKALYVFTGVEPPASFKDPSDLVEINDKLRFLMSVIGVK